MDRRINFRGKVQFPVIESDGTRGTCINVSSTGILVERGEAAQPTESAVVSLELHLPGWSRPLTVQAAPVWAQGTRQAFRFVSIPDADRLDVAETLDKLQRRASSPALV